MAAEQIVTTMAGWMGGEGLTRRGSSRKTPAVVKGGRRSVLLHFDVDALGGG